MYMAGEGTPRDTLSAVEYFEKAMVAGTYILYISPRYFLLY
jgi:hypothetical protein